MEGLNYTFIISGSNNSTYQNGVYKVSLNNLLVERAKCGMINNTLDEWDAMWSNYEYDSTTNNYFDDFSISLEAYIAFFNYQIRTNALIYIKFDFDYIQGFKKSMKLNYWNDSLNGPTY